MDDNKNNQSNQNNQNGSNQAAASNTTDNKAKDNKNQGSQGQQSSQGGQSQNNQGSSSNNGSKTFTQEQVNRMMATEKNQGRDAAFREMGIDPNDPNAMGMMDMFKAFMVAMKTPEQQAKEQFDQQQIRIAEVESRARKAEIKAEAMQLGVLPQYVDDAVSIVLPKLDDKTDVKTVITELKTRYPIWFGSDNGDQGSGQGGNNGKVGQNGTGSSVGNAGGKGQGNNGVAGIGARLAASRKAANKKPSFWD